MDYYQQRVAYLADLAECLAASVPIAWVEYDELLAAPATVLGGICRYLQLTGQFDTRYAVQPFTGRRGVPGPFIRTGMIQTSATRAHSPWDGPLLPGAVEAFERCRSRLRSLASAQQDSPH